MYAKEHCNFVSPMQIGSIVRLLDTKLDEFITDTQLKELLRKANSNNNLEQTTDTHERPDHAVDNLLLVAAVKKVYAIYQNDWLVSRSLLITQ